MTKNSDHAKHMFFYLLAFFALGFVATAIGQVVFQLINRAIVETTPSYSGDYTQGVLRFAVSALIIAAPIYYFATRKINSELARDNLDPDSAIRRWLTYFAIFIASAVAIGDLIFTLNSFLSGELTVKFLLKATTIFAIVGGFGAYYFFDLKRQDFTRDARLRIFGGVFIAILLTCLVAAFTLVDSPFRARELREDRERLSELQQISYAITDFYNQNSALPQNLETLVEDSKIREEVLRDPVSDEKYQFETVDSQNYKLCANFTYSNSEENPREYFVDPAWEHDSGRACFSIAISEKENNYPRVEVKPL
ncbi:DUF5671 domain-containing protein [Candidatus Gracilibacteria bacterium]|nr:DUF5671 domain-containing protein [Candidatus Gracilibacteria bacterium]MCF7856720.1 DUF5671 domain-containing protein [Candidatus Gracilibacteria bacterium]MCF7897029.1 DUF5671 domain-containing protein [Candidatus Gracilibacteria bacterium]